jgi:hypothetical protein
MWKEMPYLFADKHNRGIITRKPDRMAFVFFQYHKHAPNSFACTHITCGYTLINWHSDCWKSIIQTPKHHQNAKIDSFVGERGTYRPSSYMHMNNRTQFSTSTHNTVVQTQTNLSLDECRLNNDPSPSYNKHTHIHTMSCEHTHSIPRTLRVSFVHANECVRAGIPSMVHDDGI